MSAQGVEQCGAARRVGKLWRDEDASDGQGRARQLLDGAHSLGREQSLALAGFPAPQIAC
jgi:hypothetical protein